MKTVKSKFKDENQKEKPQNEPKNTPNPVVDFYCFPLNKSAWSLRRSDLLNFPHISDQKSDEKLVQVLVLSVSET